MFRPSLSILILILFVFSGCSVHKLSPSEKRIISAEDPGTQMYVLNIFNQQDSLILRSRSKPVDRIGSANIKLLQDRMLATVQHPDSRGVGIAAPQVGILRQVILVQRFDKEDHAFEACFNPVILRQSTQMVTRDEGCLSIPGYRGPVERPDSIEVKYLDKHGKEHVEWVYGFTARIFQHEIDHLNGILYIDLMSPDSLKQIAQP